MNPKYLHIYQDIRDKILHNTYPTNSQLPDEITLTKIYDCSRMTIKKALDLLVNEGMIYRKRGQGTFVMTQMAQKRKLIVSERELIGLTKTALRADVPVGSEVLQFHLEFASETVADFLQIPVSSPVYYIERLRLIDHQPYVIEHTYMNPTLTPGITEDILHQSVYAYLEQELQLKIASSKKILRAAPSNDEEQQYLNLKPTEPVFEVEQIGYLDNGTPFEYSISHHRYDLFEFTSFGFSQQ